MGRVEDAALLQRRAQALASACQFEAFFKGRGIAAKGQGSADGIIGVGAGTHGKGHGRYGVGPLRGPAPAGVFEEYPREAVEIGKAEGRRGRRYGQQQKRDDDMGGYPSADGGKYPCRAGDAAAALLHGGGHDGQDAGAEDTLHGQHEDEYHGGVYDGRGQRRACLLHSRVIRRQGIKDAVEAAGRLADRYHGAHQLGKAPRPEGLAEGLPLVYRIEGPGDPLLCRAALRDAQRKAVGRGQSGRHKEGKLLADIGQIVIVHLFFTHSYQNLRLIIKNGGTKHVPPW